MNIYTAILVMAATTYLVRAVPILIFKKPISSPFLRSFLHYVPIACLTAMTFPAILSSTDHVLSGTVGLIVAVILALTNKSLITVAATGCLAVFLAELVLCSL